MNFVEQDKDYCDKEGQEEEEEEEEVMMTRSKLPFSFPPSSSSPSPSPSSSSTKYRNFTLQNQNLWLPSSDQSRQTSINFDNKLEFTDLSLGNENRGGGSESTEREHMFDKVVTPSDVGKLNRLVIPKQHAEKYFPLDSSSNEKGLLLNFEDRNGKPWRFRYSYWNSSQSYVMTKGWSRFVKEKKLDAGDIVSFQRGVGESGKHRLYIDWRRRPNAPDPTSFSHLELQNQLHFPPSVRWGRLYSLPQPLSIPRPYEQSQFHHLNYHHRYHNYHPQATPHQYYLRPPAGALQIGEAHQHGGGEQPQTVIDSVPVVHGRSVGKRLRLFGVNMECPTQDDQCYSNSSSDNLLHVGSFSPHHYFVSSSSLPRPQYQSTILLPSSSSGGPMPTTEADHELSKKGKTSLSFDLDL